MRWFALLAVLALLAGCGGGSVLLSGVSGLGGQKRIVTDSAARADARAVYKQWVAEMTSRAKADPSQRFDNLPLGRLRALLAKEAQRDDFTVKVLRELHPRQAAPLVIVQTRHYVAFAHDVGAIEQQLDPHRGRADGKGWAFEGFLLEAQDERGVPFLGAFNFVRGSGPGGGQWARADRLYPFAHG
jgi:hypothetical protein